MSGRVRVVKKGRGKSEGKVAAVSPSRAAAFEVLRRVEEEGAFAAPLLAALDLSAEDRGLCYELVLGVLRRQSWLDRLAAHLAGRDAASLDAPVRRALRLGLYQLRFLTRVPARAAVNESVNLVHAARMRSAAPFVNAVLRRADREREFDPAAAVRDPLERAAVETSHPAWLLRRWAEAFGREEARAFAHANNSGAPAAFRLNPLRAESAAVVERLREAGAVVTPSRLAPGAWRVEGGGALLRELAEAGAVYMQDEASQMVAHVLDPRPGERLLDACAAPGSKATHLAALAADRAVVVAGDLYAHRLRLVAESAARQDLKSVRPFILDAEAGLPFQDEAFDRVLVDAPCTGTGTLRHNPEIRWRLRPSDIGELAARQRRILTAAARVVRRGGRLVYSTCSVEREENEEVVADFLRHHPAFRQSAAAPAPAPTLLPDGSARTWPHRDDTDGFYVAAFEKVTGDECQKREVMSDE